MIPTLVLFDIDATLLTTTRAGVLAVGDAGRALFGSSFEENIVAYAGGLDPVIMGELLAAHDLPNTPADVQRFRSVYARKLDDRLAQPGAARALPGVVELLEALGRVERLTLGLLTGNFPETGAAKLAAAGIDISQFRVRVWGSDSPRTDARRDHLPEVALERYASLHGREIPARRVTIIGDTVHDVRCARAFGCRSLGVATGTWSRDALLEAGADLAVDDLADTNGLTSWLTMNTDATPAG